MVHSSAADDEYNGYFIPKGATIVANAWYVRSNRILFVPSLIYIAS